MSQLRRGLGYRPSTPRAGDERFADHRGHLFGGVLPASDSRFRDHVHGIRDQGMAEQCVGLSLAQDCEIQQSYEGLSYVPLSGSFPWWCARQRLGDDKLNVGTIIGVCVDAIGKDGLPPDDDWPTARAELDFYRRPSMLAFEHAFQVTPTIFRVGSSEDEIKAALLVGPLTVGLPVNQAFTEIGEHTSPIGPPDLTTVVGNHAMTLAAYDPGGLWVPQTWGTMVGNAGWYYLSWQYVTEFADEIVLVKYAPATWGQK